MQEKGGKKAIKKAIKKEAALRAASFTLRNQTTIKLALAQTVR